MVYSPVTISRIFIYSVPLLVTYDKIRRAKKLMIQLKSNFVIYDSEGTIYWILKYLKPNISNNSSKRTVTSLSFNPFSNITIPSLPWWITNFEEGSFRQSREDIAPTLTRKDFKMSIQLLNTFNFTKKKNQTKNRIKQQFRLKIVNNFNT